MNAHSNLPTLPSDIDIEQGIIGACILRPSYIATIESICSPKDFFHNPHPRLVEAMFALSRDGKVVSPLAVQGEVGSDIGLDIPTHEYLARAAEAAPVSDTFDNARRLTDLTLRREAMIAFMDGQEQISDRGLSVTEIMRPIVEVADRAAVTGGKRDFIPVAEAAQDMLRSAQSALEGKAIPSVSTGLKGLDDALGGLQAGDLAVYAGRPGMGKSALLMTTALAASRQGRPTLVFSLEMNQVRLLERMACDIDFDTHPHDPLSYHWFRKGEARAHQVERLARAVAGIPNHLTIYDRGDLTIHEIAAISRSHAQRSSIMGVVIIDYLQKVRATDRYKGNKVNEITEISGAAKALAMRIGWPVVVGAQLNRGVEQREEKRPSLSDIRESGSIEQDADQVVGMYRPAYYVEMKKPAARELDPSWPEWQGEYAAVKNQLDLIVLKNRHGSQESVETHCDMRASAIRDKRR